MAIDAIFLGDRNVFAPAMHRLVDASIFWRFCYFCYFYNILYLVVLTFTSVDKQQCRLDVIRHRKPSMTDHNYNMYIGAPQSGVGGGAIVGSRPAGWGGRGQ